MIKATKYLSFPELSATLGIHSHYWSRFLSTAYTGTSAVSPRSHVDPGSFATLVSFWTLTDVEIRRMYVSFHSKILV